MWRLLGQGLNPNLLLRQLSNRQSPPQLWEGLPRNTRSVSLISLGLARRGGCWKRIFCSTCPLKHRTNSSAHCFTGTVEANQIHISYLYLFQARLRLSPTKQATTLAWPWTLPWGCWCPTSREWSSYLPKPRWSWVSSVRTLSLQLNLM